MATNFEFPKIYDFPPFFTKQPVETTWVSQRRKWSDLILQYCKANKKFILNVKNDLNSELFRNDKISRSLGQEVLLEILDFMSKEGEIEWDLSLGKNVQAYVYWKKPSEWASYLHSWVLYSYSLFYFVALYTLHLLVIDQGLANTVMTAFELTNPDPATNDLILDQNSDLFAINPEVLSKALKILKAQGKATLFTGTDASSLGIKFHAT